MAIEDFGSSLLSRVHEQKRRQRKKRESYEKKAALASVVVPIGVKAVENVLQTKAANFLASEQMMARKNKVENAIETGNFYENQEREIQASTLAGPEYFRAKLTPMWQTMGRERYPEEFHGMGPYAELTAEQVGLLADREWEKHQQGIALSRRMGSMEDYQTMSALNTKDVRPTNIVDEIGRQFSTVFGGKSTKERELEAIKAIENSNIFTTAEALNSLHDTYERTTQLPVAYSYAEFIEKIEGVDKSKLAPQPREELFSVGNRVYTRSIQMTWNQDAEMWEQSYVKGPDGLPVITEIKDLTDPNSTLAAHKATFNFATQSRLILSDKGMEAWYNEIKNYNESNKDNPDYIPLNPVYLSKGEKGIAEYKELSVIFQKITEDPDNLQADQDTLLLLGQLFTQLVDDIEVENLTGDIDAARDWIRRANENESMSVTVPGVGNIPLLEDNLQVFEDYLEATQHAHTDYFFRLAEISQSISESITGLTRPSDNIFGALTETGDLTDEEQRIRREEAKGTLEETLGSVAAELEGTMGSIEAAREEARVARQAQITNQPFVDTLTIEEVTDMHDRGLITDGDYQYFMEYGELPK